MAKIFVALYNFGRKKDDFDAMPPFYESFINGLKDAGNDVLCFHQKTYTRDFEGEIPALQKRILMKFNPELCILFNNKFWDISNIVDCPIIIYDVDSPLVYSGTDRLKANVERYKFVTSQSAGIELIKDTFSALESSVALIPFFTEIHHNSETPVTSNISFLGSNWLWKGYTFVNKFIGDNPTGEERAYAKRIIESFTKYPFNTADQIKDELGIKPYESKFDFSDENRAAIEISGLRRLRYLSAISDLGLEIRGAYWKIPCMNYFPEVALCYNSQQTFTKQENEDFYNSSKISINTKHIQAQNGFSFRVCDIMASNACLVSEYSQDLKNLFPKVNIPMFSTPEEERKICKKILKNEDLRLEIVEKAQEAIDKNHRFANVLEGLEYIGNMTLRGNQKGFLKIYSDEDIVSYNAVVKEFVDNFDVMSSTNIVPVSVEDKKIATVPKKSLNIKNAVIKAAKTTRDYLFASSMFGIRKVSDTKSNLYICYIPILAIRKTPKYRTVNLWLIDGIVHGAFALAQKWHKSISVTADGWNEVSEFGVKKQYAPEQKFNDLFVTLEYIDSVLEKPDNDLQRLLNKKNVSAKKKTRSYYEKTKKEVEMYLDKFDASKLPKATGDLRAHQLQLLDLVSSIKNILEDVGMHPILTGGNLLGAVRHGGFIPWDDDIDLDIIRSEYDSVLDVLKESCLYCDTSTCKNWTDYYKTIDSALRDSFGTRVCVRTFSGIKVYQGDSVKTALSVDILPLDCIAPKVSEQQFKDFWWQAKTALFKKCKNWGEAFTKMDDIVHNSGIFAPISNRFYYGLGNHGFWNFKYSGTRSSDILFPYRRIQFEGESFYAPNDIDGFLTPLYGNYMTLPTKIVISQHLTLAKQYLGDENRK